MIGDVMTLVWWSLVVIGLIALAVLGIMFAWEDVEEHQVTQQRLDNQAAARTYTHIETTQREGNAHREAMFQSFALSMKALGQDGGGILGVAMSVGALCFFFGFLLGMRSVRYE